VNFLILASDNLWSLKFERIYQATVAPPGEWIWNYVFHCNAHGTSEIAVELIDLFFSCKTTNSAVADKPRDAFCYFFRNVRYDPPVQKVASRRQRSPPVQGLKYCAVIHNMCSDNLRLCSDKGLFVQWQKFQEFVATKNTINLHCISMFLVTRNWTDVATGSSKCQF